MTPEERFKRARLYDSPGGGELLTKQSEKDAADINLIVKTYGRTGAFANVNPIEPRYQDNTGVVDLVDAYQLVREAQDQFDSLPAEVRALADNNPIRFAEMLTDEGAVAALKAVGLPIKEKPAPTVESLLEGIHETLRAPEKAGGAPPAKSN
ncbi:MAG: internal scaffolding protein [Microvirus sp.]|nr:MAG: internal scaffolding protein [Microvirus sp.]